MADRLHIETFPLGDWMTNCYVVHRESPQLKDRPCWIIDAGFSPEPLIAYIREHGLTPAAVILTHCHVDHIAGLEILKAVWPGLPIYVHEAEREFLTEPALNLSIALDEPIEAPPATNIMRDGDELTLDGFRFTARHTPGHSPGGTSLYNAEHGVVFAGDVLFHGSVGRTDFPTSQGAALLRSIREQLLTLPDTTRVYPGHGPATTIGNERRSNPFLRDIGR